MGGGLISSDPEIAFGRWHAGRSPRGATHPILNARVVRVLHSKKPPMEDGAGSPPFPASSFPGGHGECPLETHSHFSAEVLS